MIDFLENESTNQSRAPSPGWRLKFPATAAHADAGPLRHNADTELDYNKR